MACDICGKVGVPTRPLRDLYRTPEIADMCDACDLIVNKQLRSIQSMTVRIQCALLKAFMGERKSQITRPATPTNDASGEGEA